jgi:hypothetical protein
MRGVLRIGATLLIVGFFLFLPCGGLRVRGDAEGNWLLLGPVQLAGAGLLLAGIALTVVAACLMGSRSEATSGRSP